METKYLVALRRGLERQIKEATHSLNLIARELDQRTKHSAGTDGPLDSHGFKKPEQPEGRDGAEWRAYQVWEQLRQDGFTITELSRLADKGKKGKDWVLTPAAYYHVVSGWEDMGVVLRVEEGSGPKPSKYKKVRPQA